MSRRNLFNKVVNGDNERWSVVKTLDELWLAATPDNSDYPECHFDDRWFKNYSDALIYATEQAERDAVQKRLV